MIRMFTLLLITITILTALPPAQANTATEQNAVLVNGASSGLGRVMAETMSATGYFAKQSGEAAQ